MTCSRLLVEDVEQRPGTWLKLLTKTLSKSLWHDANLVRHATSLLNASDAKCPESATREVDIVSQITASISRILTQDKYLSNTLGKKLFFPSWWYIQTCLTHQERNLNGRRLPMGVFRDDLEQIYDTTWQNTKYVRGGDTKTNQRLAGTRQSGLPVILCQLRNNLLW